MISIEAWLWQCNMNPQWQFVGEILPILHFLALLSLHRRLPLFLCSKWYPGGRTKLKLDHPRALFVPSQERIARHYYNMKWPPSLSMVIKTVVLILKCFFLSSNYCICAVWGNWRNECVWQPWRSPCWQCVCQVPLWRRRWESCQRPWQPLVQW